MKWFTRDRGLHGIQAHSVGQPLVNCHVRADRHSREAAGTLVFKNLQSTVRPEVLEELMDRGEGVSESPFIIKHHQVTRAYIQTSVHTGVSAGSSCTVERKPTPVIPTRCKAADCVWDVCFCTHMNPPCVDLEQGYF